MDTAKRGDEMVPPDMRYLLRGLPAKGERQYGDTRARTVTFLQGIYNSVAECLPDFRDDGYDADELPTVNDLKVPELGDPYTEILGQEGKPLLKPFGGKQRLTRKKKFSLSINLDRKDEVKFLPPGNMKDYWEQMVAAETASNLPPVPFTTFWRTWYEEFNFMKFRTSSSHAACGACLRHKMLLKELSGFVAARAEQARHYSAHLRNQYQDRVCYWECRASSRMRLTHACLILDGMDQGKFAYPRSDTFRAKCLNSLQRPRAHISGLILHGRLILFTISPADLPKDSNACIEMTAHALQLLSKEVDLSRVVLSVQADNTTREVKNNHFIRFLTFLTSHGCWSEFVSFFKDFLPLVWLRFVHLKMLCPFCCIGISDRKSTHSAL